jgi:hypothetical protein
VSTYRHDQKLEKNILPQAPIQLVFLWCIHCVGSTLNENFLIFLKFAIRYVLRIVIECPTETPVVLEINNVDRQFSGFMTERASKCVISPFQWPMRLRIAFPIVWFLTVGKHGGSPPTDDYSIIPDTARPDFRTVSGPNSL